MPRVTRSCESPDEQISAIRQVRARPGGGEGGDEGLLDAQGKTRRPAVLRCLHAIDATRLHERRRWVVLFSILRPFGPRRDRVSHTGVPRGVRVPEDRGVGPRRRGFQSCQIISATINEGRGDALHLRQLRSRSCSIIERDEVLPAGRAASARERVSDLRASRDVPGLDAEIGHGGYET